MDLATCTASRADAPARCDRRAQRIGKVKFVALVIEPEPETVPPAETLSSSPARLYRDVRAFLIRAIERLVAARP